MRKKFLIYVDVDMNQEDSSYATKMARGLARFLGFPIYKVAVRNSGQAYDAFILAAHELGHVIGREFQLPRTMSDPRDMMPHHPFSIEPGSDRARGVIAGEDEAWDLAEIAMRIANAKEACMQTYKNHYEAEHCFNLRLPVPEELQ